MSMACHVVAQFLLANHSRVRGGQARLFFEGSGEQNTCAGTRPIALGERACDILAANLNTKIEQLNRRWWVPTLLRQVLSVRIIDPTVRCTALLRGVL